jgi:predicted small metal-binding protein
MKALSCRDLGKSDSFVARGMTETEVLDEMVEHHREAHPEDRGKTDEQLRDEFRGKIHEEEL